MAKFKETAVITRQEPISVDIFSMCLKTKQIAKEAKALGTGARSLRTIVEKYLKRAMFDLPDYDEVKELMVEALYKLSKENEKVELPITDSVDLFLLYVSEEEKKCAAYLSNILRMNGFVIETDYLSRSLKAQFKQADRLNSKFIIVLNSNDLENNEVTVVRRDTSEKMTVKLNDVVFC